MGLLLLKRVSRICSNSSLDLGERTVEDSPIDSVTTLSGEASCSSMQKCENVKIIIDECSTAQFLESAYSIQIIMSYLSA